MSRRYQDYPDGVAIIDLDADDVEYEYPGGRGTLPRRRDPYLHAQRQIAAPAPFYIRPAGEVRPARHLCIAHQPDSVSSQQYRLLRYKLKESNDPRVIGISSPRPVEGKTTATANLAMALAEGHQVRIVMLDLNLRRPSLSNVFGVLGGGSVAGQLQRKRRDPASYWDVLELGSRLHLISGGGPTENPAQLLNSEELCRMLFDLAEHYDYVVVDLPAVLVAADVKIVQEQLDGLVLICRFGSTTKTNINTAITQLGPSKIQGVLMLNVPPRFMRR